MGKRSKGKKTEAWKRPTADDLDIRREMEKLTAPAERNLMCVGREKTETNDGD